MEPGGQNKPRPKPPSGGGQPPQGPGDYAAPTEGGGSGKKWTIISLVVVLVAALAVGGFLLVNKNKDDSSADAGGEVFLTAAADPGRDPFSDASFAATPDPSIATAATGATPASQSVAVTASTGDQPGLYGGTNNLVVCDADKMATFLKANPDKANAWVSALNADPNLGFDAGPLTTANIPAYLATLTPIVLVSDTRVTNHGFANGQPTQLQSILQKGTAVFVDKYGVPRVRCACGNPLLPPKATKSAPKYSGKAWTGFSLAKVGVVQPAKTPLSAFQVLIPAKPGSKVASLPLGPFACVPTPGSVCKTPSGVVKKSPTGVPGGTTSPPASSAPASSSAAPSTSSAPPSTSSAPPSTSSAPPSSAQSSSPRTSAPETTQSGQITFVATRRASDTYFQLKFDGYSPNSKVTFTCSDSKGTYGPFKAFMDSSGSNNDGQANCFSSDNTITVKDRVGGTFTP